jgi:hypothetical protein
MEGSMVNLDVTAPGATLALALMFLKACCAVAVNFSFFFFFLFVSLFSYSFWFCCNGYLQKALWRLLCNLIHVYFLLLANFPLSEAQMNFDQRKEGYYITSANAIMTWTYW